MDDTTAVGEPGPLYCANHPSVETLLRCNRCGKPICTRCGIRTPVGIRCRECAQLRRPPMYVVGPHHYLLAVLVALPASVIAGLAMQQVGIYLAFFAGAAVGGLIAELVYRVVHKRGRGLAILVCGCIILGALASSGLALLFFVPGFALAALSDLRLLGSMLMQFNVVYVVLAVGAAFARLV